MKVKEIERLLAKGETVTVQGGVFLDTSENMISDQKGWDDEDPSKEIDFSAYPLWVTTDDGADPVGYTSVEDVLKDIA